MRVLCVEEKDELSAKKSYLVRKNAAFSTSPSFFDVCK